MVSKTITFSSPKFLSQLYCNNPKNLILVEEAFKVKITSRENWMQIEGEAPAIKLASQLFDILSLARTQGLIMSNADFAHVVTEIVRGHVEELFDTFENPLILKIREKSIVPKSINQKHYLQYIKDCPIVLGIGPAGTGKTYLAVAAALQALLANQVSKLILTRPAVEAGEALGFLPGDLREKILPYLRPLYDAMFDIIGVKEAHQLIETNIIEIAPLAYMRGRTLSNATIILDEAQNTTPEQMMMFLTRLGENANMIVTGDITQIDLPKSKISGLKQAIQVLSHVPDVKMHFFDNRDVIRPLIVQKVIKAYSDYFDLTESAALPFQPL